MPSERPVRSASSSSAAGCFPCPRCQEPWPNAGTTAPVGNFTVRLARLEAASLAGSTADAYDDATQEPSATQSPLNSRRFTNRIFTHYTIPSTAPIAVGRDDRSAVVVLGCTLYSERRFWTPSRGQTMMRDDSELGRHQWTWWFGCGALALESMRLRSAKTRLTKRFFRA